MKNKTIYFIFLLTLLNGIILNLGHAVTPKYIEILGIEKYWFGYFFSTMSLGHFIMGPIWGKVSDKRSRKIVYALGFLGYGIGQYLFVTFTTGPSLLIARLIAGVFSNGVIVASAALITDYTSTEERTKGLSIYAGLTMLGTSVGYYISGFLGEPFRLGVIQTFKLQAIASVIFAVVLIMLLPKHNVELKEKPKPIKLIDVLANKEIKTLLISLTFVTISFVGVTKFLDVYISDNGFSTGQIGTFIGITGIVTIFATVFVLPTVTKKFKDRNLLFASTLLGGVFVVIAFVQDNVMVSLYSFYLLFIFFKAFYEPIHQSIISKKFEGNQGAILGLRKSFAFAGNFAGPLFFGYVYGFNPLVLFVGAGVVLIVVAIIVQVKTKEA
jgi:DHA1 family multidrug resistance protein-like MFS transporter